jgi:microsomal dipeptidase-like Zn-dependent dipeptidase
LEKGDNSRRILIDIKHLSPEARTEFYDLTKGYSLIGDTIPILASHAAVTGTKNPSSAPHMYFNSSDINLYDEDVLKIARSNGLIGLMLEEGRLLNKQAMKALNDKYGDHLANSPDVSAEILIAQMLHIVNVCGGKEGWDIICIGSDFDGMINSLDAFDSVEKYPDLFERIHKLLTDETPILQINWEPYELHNNTTTLLYPSQSVHNLKFGLTPDEIIEKIAYKNIENFLEKYFNDRYLKSPSENQAKTIA